MTNYDEFKKKAKNFFIIGKISEEMNMPSEAVSNYFKSLTAVNDFELSKLGLHTTDHNNRFNLLRYNLPESYETTDKLFSVYRRTYTQELSKEEVNLLREKIEEVFKNAEIDIPKN